MTGKGKLHERKGYRLAAGLQGRIPTADLTVCDISAPVIVISI